MDPFSDLIRLLRLRVSIYHNARVCGNWRIKEHHLGQTCFHMATQGSCQLEVPGHLTTQLGAGDVVIFPREIEHTMISIEASSGEQRHLTYSESQHLPGTGMLCGKASFSHRGSDQLLASLPAVFVIKNTPKTPWLPLLNRLILDECLQPSCGSDVVLDRLSELLFIGALRQHSMENRVNVGLLALYADQRLSRALTVIHTKPSDVWTLEKLAQHAMMSRSLFAEKFKLLSGWTAMKYLSWWRMQLAWQYLSAGRQVADVSESVGYRSEAAFSRAFKKQYSVAAGQVRRMAHLGNSL